MGIALGLAALLILVAMASNGGTTTSMGYAPGLPEFVKKVIADANASKADLLKAADIANVAGYPQLGDALKLRANAGSTIAASPFADVPAEKWTAFVKAMAIAKSAMVNPKGFFGLFQISVRRLSDLGIMSNPKQVSPGTWAGTWTVPKAKFIGDIALQYQAFSRSMQLYRSAVTEKYKDKIGTTIEGKRVTLSGLLGSAHVAGSEGLGKWLNVPSVRAKSKHVTAAFLRSTEIF